MNVMDYTEGFRVRGGKRKKKAKQRNKRARERRAARGGGGSPAASPAASSSTRGTELPNVDPNNDAEYAKDMAEADRAQKALEAGYDADKAALKAKEDAEFNARYGGYDQAAEDERSGWVEGLSNRTRYVDTNDYDALVALKGGGSVMYFYLKMLGMYLVVLIVIYFMYQQARAMVPFSGEASPSWVLVCAPLVLYMFVKTWDAVAPVRFFSTRVRG